LFNGWDRSNLKSISVEQPFLICSKIEELLQFCIQFCIDGLGRMWYNRNIKSEEDVFCEKDIDMDSFGADDSFRCCLRHSVRARRGTKKRNGSDGGGFYGT
jgi:hypothetical protein